LLAVRGRLAPGEVITALAPVAAAVAYVHGEGVVHGDVSAANVLFTEHGVPLLADLGVARLTGDDSDAESTPAYVDPAVASGCVPGPPSDVFMLGAVALHALTGTPPWPGGTAAESLAAASTGELADVADRLAGAGVPAAMSAVLCRALTVDPQRRGTAADFALDLRYSGRPVAVELAAGRARREPAPSGPRHAARPVLRAAVGAQADADGAAHQPDDPARPAFERPSVPRDDDPSTGAQPPTRMLGPRPRPVIPRPEPRRPQRLLVAASAVLAALVAAAVVWWGGGGSAPAAPTARRPASHAAAVSKAPSKAPSRAPSKAPSRATSPSGTRPAPSPPTRARRQAGWPAALATLDARRARAFATRDVRLLRGVYLPGPLLRADVAELTRLVPAGCGLLGAHTRFTHLRVADHGRWAVVEALARLPSSDLRCSGATTGHAAATRPQALRLTLVGTAHGIRIRAVTTRRSPRVAR
jgi:hypothetical protein